MTMRINIDTHSLDTSTLIAFAKFLTEKAQTVISDDTFLTELLNLIKSDINETQEIVSKGGQVSSGISSAVRDSLRDEAFVALRDYVKACANRHIAETSEAAKFILDIFKKHGWSINRLDDEMQSEKLNELILELKTDQASKALNKINAGVWFRDLEEAQNEFENQENNHQYDAHDYQNLSNAKAHLNKHLSVLLDCIEVMYEISPHEKFGEIIHDLNHWPD